MSWQRGSTAPRDGTMYLFMTRSLTTAALIDPLVGRYYNDRWEWNNGGRWEEWSEPPVQWAPIPPIQR
jgi:hypothetical protein